jgi:hypothetical protein
MRKIYSVFCDSALNKFYCINTWRGGVLSIVVYIDRDINHSPDEEQVLLFCFSVSVFKEDSRRYSLLEISFRMTQWIYVCVFYVSIRSG